jgi:uncharacterized protein
MSLLLNLLHEIWTILLEMAPFLLLGFFLAGLLSVIVSQDLIERWLGKRGFTSVVKASLFGVPLPLCSCGVIPVTTSLYKRGASKGATTSFLTSTPQTGVDSILATIGLMGPVFAWFRVAVALVSGIIAGALVDLFENEANKPGPTGKDTHAPVVTSLGEKISAILKYGFYTLPQDIGKSLILGIVLAGLLGALLPDNWGETYLSNPWLTYLGVTLIAIPMYVCSTGSIPIAFALMASGVSPGATLVFLIAGPATNAATITTLFKMLGRRTIAIYLCTIVVISWLSGWLLDMYGGSLVKKSLLHHHAESGYSLVQFLSAVALIGMVLWTYLYPQLQKRNGVQTMESENTITLKVEGMTCSHCANSVVRALETIPGVTSARADQTQNLAWVEGENIEKCALGEAIGKAGYDFKGFV